MIKAIGKLRNTGGSFSARRLKVAAGIDPIISDCTVGGYWIDKGTSTWCLERTLKSIWLLHKKWKVCCLRISRLLLLFFTWMKYHFLIRIIHVTKRLVRGLWCGGNGAKVWPLIGAMGHFIVAIAHGKGVVLCEQYIERFTSAYFVRLSIVPIHMENSSCWMVTLSKTQRLLKRH